MTEQRHWSQREEQPTAPIRTTIRVELITPAFGQAVAVCECGARAEIRAEGTTNPIGRPRKPRTAEQAAEEWAANHVAQSHATAEQWELRRTYLLRPPREGEQP